MTSENVSVRITGELRTHLQQQISERGLYEDASEYVRSLIRQDLKSGEEAWEWLRNKLEPALRADESAYAEAAVDDVISRNKEK